MNVNLTYFLTMFGSGAVIPFLVSLFCSPRWPRGVRALLAFLLSVGAAFWQTRSQWIPGDWYANAALLFGAVQLAYHGFLKHVGLPALEQGSTNAWNQLLKSILGGLGQRSDASHAEQDSSASEGPVERILKLDQLLNKKVITKEQYEWRLAQIQEEELKQI